MATNLTGAPPPINGPTTPSTANSPPQPLPPSPGNRPSSNFPNRFDVETQKQLQRPFGISGPEILKLKSDGHNDWPRKIKMAIIKEYFTMGQYLGGVAVGVGIGVLTMFIIAYTALDLNVELSGTGHDTTIWGAFFVAFGVMEFVGRVESRRPLVCDPYSNHVDRPMRGRPCIDPKDCTVSTHIAVGTCIHRPVGGLVGVMRYIVPSIAMVAGIIALVAGRISSGGAPAKLVVPPVFLGASMGIIWGYLFS